MKFRVESSYQMKIIINKLKHLLECVLCTMVAGILFGFFVSVVWMFYALISASYPCFGDIIRKLIYTGILGTIFGMTFGFLFYIFDSFKNRIANPY